MSERLTTDSQHARHWPWLLIGIGLFVLGPLLYVLQFQAHLLRTPWYAPILATVGVLCIAVSWRKHGRWWRAVTMMVLGVLTTGEWYMVLVETATPAYSGPAIAGARVPEFQARRIDGAVFTQQDLSAGQRSIVIFFRGRW